jgi:hypothetical protein
MCLKTTLTEPKIAEKDITCYKVIRKDMTSLYHDDFKWEFGKMYHSLIEAVNDSQDRNKEIHQAFHSYETLEDLKKAYFSATVPCLTVKCTIPKGSTVYSGSHDNLKGYASNQLIINEVIGIKELYPNFDWDNYPYKEGQVIQINLSYSNIWKDYQITNIQLHEGRKGSRVDLIVENCETSDSNFIITKFDVIITKFDGGAWVSDKEVRLKDNKEE